MSIDLLAIVRQRILVGEGSILSLPQSLLRIRRLANALETDVYDIEKCILQDPPFAGYLLKLANSSLLQVGRQPCTNVADAVRRQGIQSVAQLAMVYVLQRKHMLKVDSAPLQLLLQKNWQRSTLLAKEALSEFHIYRANGSRASRRIDSSDILLLGTLFFSGSLAVLSASSLPGSQVQCTKENAEEIERMVLSLNTCLLPEIYRFWNIETIGNQVLQSGVCTGKKQPLRAADFVRLILLRRKLALCDDEVKFMEENKPELEHFEHLGLDLNLD